MKIHAKSKPKQTESGKTAVMLRRSRMQAYKFKQKSDVQRTSKIGGWIQTKPDKMTTEPNEIQPEPNKLRTTSNTIQTE